MAKQQLWEMLAELKDVLTDIPERADIAEYCIKLTMDDVIYSKAYPVPFSTQDTIKREVDTMLKLGVIERSKSKKGVPHCSHGKKKDGTLSFSLKDSA